MFLYPGGISDYFLVHFRLGVPVESPNDDRQMRKLQQEGVFKAALRKLRYLKHPESNGILIQWL